VSLTAREHFQNSSINVVLDSAVELRERLEAYSNLYKLFGFLTQFKSMTYDEVKKCSSNLVDIYPNDIEEIIVNEFLQFTSIVAEAEALDSHDDTATDSSSNVLRLNELLTDRQGLLMSTFLNVGIVLKLYLTLPVTNCEGHFPLCQK